MQPYKGGSGTCNRYRITPQTIIKTEPAAFAGIEVPVRADLIRITLPYAAEILLDGELCIRAPGQYTIRRYVENIRIRLSNILLGPALSNVGNRGPCLIDTGPSDVEIHEINPDLLPVAVFGLKSAAMIAGAANATITTVANDWNIPLGFDLPDMIWVKSMFAWIESPGGQPPVAGMFLYGVRLIKNDSDGAENWRIMEANGGSTEFGNHWPMHNAMMPLASLFEQRAAETPQIMWFWDTSVAPVGGMNVTAGVVASYMRRQPQ